MHSLSLRLQVEKHNREASIGKEQKTGGKKRVCLEFVVVLSRCSSRRSSGRNVGKRSETLNLEKY